MDKPLILIVEDDQQIRNFLNIYLKAQGYGCIETRSGQAALALTAANNPDIVILDLGLPDLDGLEVIRTLRGWSQIPIIVVSAREQDSEKAKALDLGADDYLTKPFSTTELAARIRVALRHMRQRRGQDESAPSNYKVGELRIEFDKHRVFMGEQEIHLTPIEYNLLALMAKHAGKVLTHNYILREVWGTYAEGDMQSLRVFMASIRRKIEANPAQPRYIITEVGVGYRFADE